MKKSVSFHLCSCINIAQILEKIVSRSRDRRNLNENREWNFEVEGFLEGYRRERT